MKALNNIRQDDMRKATCNNAFPEQLFGTGNSYFLQTLHFISLNLFHDDPFN